MIEIWTSVKRSPAFAALSQETRLRIVRLLVQAGAGRPCRPGAIADAVKVSPSNVSFHLKELERTGMIVSRRDARSIIYAADYETLGGVIRFLMEDCCAGRPEICAPVLAAPCCSVTSGEESDARCLTSIDKNVLFLCTGNSARSIMAEAILNREGARKIPRLFRRQPAEGRRSIPIRSICLRKLNFDVRQLRSKSWDEFTKPDAPRIDFVFTVCDSAAQESCPVMAGQGDDGRIGACRIRPAATGNEAEIRLAFADAFRMLNQRITIFVNLPHDVARSPGSGAAALRHRQEGVRHRVGCVSDPVSLARRLAAEGLGTAFLLATVIGSGIMARAAGGRK